MHSDSKNKEEEGEDKLVSRLPVPSEEEERKEALLFSFISPTSVITRIYIYNYEGDKGPKKGENGGLP